MMYKNDGYELVGVSEPELGEELLITHAKSG